MLTTISTDTTTFAGYFGRQGREMVIYVNMESDELRNVERLRIMTLDGERLEYERGNGSEAN